MIVNEHISDVSAEYNDPKCHLLYETLIKYRLTLD